MSVISRRFNLGKVGRRKKREKKKKKRGTIVHYYPLRGNGHT